MTKKLLDSEGKTLAGKMDWEKDEFVKKNPPAEDIGRQIIEEKRKERAYDRDNR